MEIQLTEGMIWLIIAIISGVVEAITLSITSIWFVFGALVAWIIAEFGAPFIVQLVVFIIVSSILLYFTKPLLKKYLKIGRERTNADSLIGEIGIVTEEIDTIKAEGQMEIRGQIWSAKTLEDEGVIKKDSRVKVLDIQGVKLVVKKIKMNKEEED